MTDPVALAREWEVWAADNLLRGVPREQVEAHLVSHGVDAALAASTVDALLASPLYEASRPFVRDARRWAMTAKMRERLERDAAHPHDVERRDAPSAEEFFDSYYAAQRPVILRGLVDRWPAFERWSFAALADRHGDAEVLVTIGRDDDPLYGATFRRKTETIPLRELIRRIEAAAAPTNDFYLVAQSKALEGPLRAMVDDISMPEGWLRTEQLPKGASLWMGPAGTITRLHHDFVSLLACHVRGRKRWRLVPPTERALLDRVARSHTTLDPELDPLEGVLVKDFVVEPGEALFVPVGWWHHVRALEPSITVSLGAWPRDETELRYLRLGSG